MSQSSKKQAKRHVQIEAANPVVDLDPCLGKVKFDTEESASAESSFRPYFCGWGAEPHWHTSAHGFKGARAGR